MRLLEQNGDANLGLLAVVGVEPYKSSDGMFVAAEAGLH